MGYRTNQCQHCGQYGHNRRGCPQIKEAYARVERLAEKYGIERSEDELAYASTAWIERINEAAKIQDADEDEISWRDRWLWEEVEERKLAQARKNARGRQCGFCGERGHNARTCPVKKQHRKDCDAMQGLAHRVVAACLRKAGLVPGALMSMRDYNWEAGEYQHAMCMVVGIEWDKVAVPDYDHDRGTPRHLDQWFRKSFIRIRKPNGEESSVQMPQNLKERTHYGYYDEEPSDCSFLGGIVGGPVNTDRGWKGDNQRVLSDEAFGVHHWASQAKDKDMGKRIVAGGELEEEVVMLVNEVSKWSDC